MEKNWNVRLKNKRIEQKLSLSEVSKRNNRDLSQQSLIKYEKGEVLPRIDVLEDLCRMYKCSVNYVLYGSDDKNIAVDTNSTLINLWYLLVTKKIKYEDENLKIIDDELRKQAYFLNVYVKNCDISSTEDLFKLVDGIKKMTQES